MQNVSGSFRLDRTSGAGAPLALPLGELARRIAPRLRGHCTDCQQESIERMPTPKHSASISVRCKTGCNTLSVQNQRFWTALPKGEPRALPRRCKSVNFFLRTTEQIHVNALRCAASTLFIQKTFLNVRHRNIASKTFGFGRRFLLCQNVQRFPVFSACFFHF